MTILDDLKNTFGKLTIKEVENHVRQSKTASIATRRDFIMLLYYLDRTSRFRENTDYKNASFGEYIYNMYGVRKTTYDKERHAFIAHPDAVKKIGVGVVIKATRECGAIESVKAIDEITKLSKPTPEAINKVITQHKKSEPKHHKKATVSELSAEIARKDVIIAKQAQKIKEQAEQIEKLKATLADERNKIKILEPIMPYIRSENVCAQHA